MIKPLVKGALLGGLTLFAWGALSWMLLPWHDAVMLKMTDGDAVARAIQAATPRSGVYMYPYEEHGKEISAEERRAAEERLARGPLVFMAVRKEGFAGMGGAMAVSFLIQCLAAFIASWLLLKAPGLSYGGRVRFVLLFFLGAGALCHLPHWNWFGFSTGYTLVATADLAAGGLLAGLALARAARP